MRLLLEVFVLSLIVVVRTQTTIQATASGIQATGPVQTTAVIQTTAAAQTSVVVQTTQASLATQSTVSPDSPLQTFITNITSAPLSTAITVGNALFLCCGNLLNDIVSCSNYVHFNLSYDPVSLWNQAATFVSCFCAQSTYLNTALTCKECCISAAPLTFSYYAFLDTSICLNPIEAISLTPAALSGDSASYFPFVPVPGPADPLNTAFRFYGNAATTTAFGNSPAETYNQQTSSQTSTQTSSSLSSSTVIIIVVVVAVALIAVAAAVIVFLCYRRNRNQKTNGSQAIPLPAYPPKPQQPVHFTPPPPQQPVHVAPPPQRPVHVAPPPQRPVHVTPPPQQPVHVTPPSTTLPSYADIMAQRKRNDHTTAAQVTQQPQLAIDHQNPSSYDDVAAKPDEITAKPDDITAKPDDWY
ncbi:hypothetical protein BC937DRAFT_86371 [Endogone sp. FLAS-F59071]|nr:hypothetical protein BC937DRAFT_86371 [Endogone sp. FLAS-F59071]|eukprot:RUS13081.1 hypothetical protein BC937DRAFT_86371 [Endogone sp. FLAS-F59071]